MFLVFFLSSRYSSLEYGSAISGIPTPESFPGQTEAACINEAFADIVGIAFEYWLESSTDYLVGERCTKGSSPIRSLINATNSLTVGYSSLNDLFR